MSGKTNIGELQPNTRKLKKLYSKIKKQMEFYFSDSNLVKDKFLNDLISKDPDGFVDLDVFKKFNKIKALTNSSEVIATSVTRSDMFEISKDRKRVRRVTPIELSKDFDACTLYIEKLPHNADQKWVKDILGRFGCITYVNVPRYKATNKIKGFAFVEFKSPEGVKNACEFYKMSSEKEGSASEDGSKIVKNTKKRKHEETDCEKKSKKSRTRSVSESSDKNHSESEGEMKKLKESTKEDLIAPKSTDEPKTEHSLLQPEGQMTTDEENMEMSNDHMNGTKIEKSKRKRKRKNSKKHNSDTERPILRVMPKSEWKAFRNKYLELQRTTMSLLKKQIMLETQELKEQEGNVKSVDVSENKKPLQFIPGIIIKVKLIEPVKNQSEIKTQVKSNAVVAYVDAPVESSEIFIRCHNSEDAQAIVKEEKLNHLGKAELIEGDEEKKYWDKIETDRKNKFNNPVIHKKRGRDKIIAKAAKLEEMKNKHIFFDD